MINRTYAQLKKSTKKHGELKNLMDQFQIDKLLVLQIHYIRWLS